MARKVKRQMARRIQSRAVTRPASSGRPNVVSFFETKLEAEWGPFDLKRALEQRPQNLVVLDTRPADAFQKEHIPEAVNIPGPELETRLNKLPRNKEIVPYCWNITCHLATRAALVLAREGYRVHELVGGIDRWKASDFPVKSAPSREPVLTA